MDLSVGLTLRILAALIVIIGLAWLFRRYYPHGASLSMPKPSRPAPPMPHCKPPRMGTNPDPVGEKPAHCMPGPPPLGKNADMDAATVQIAKLELRPGDTLVLMVKTMISINAHDRMLGHLQSKVPIGAKVLILDGDVKIAVFKTAPADGATT